MAQKRGRNIALLKVQQTSKEIGEALAAAAGRKETKASSCRN